MREIKFRALNTKMGFWLEQDELVFCGGNWYEDWRCFEDGKHLNTQDCAVMQYTGLKDKNGVEIYEGDILKCASRIYTNLGATGTGEYEETIKQVIWKDDSWGTRVISSNLTSKGAEKSGLVISAKYAEVIGNIYENPELLSSGIE